MNIGMLWFDNNTNTPLPSKIMRAAKYYREKYGRSPDLCFLNPVMLENGSRKAGEGLELGKEGSFHLGEIEVRGSPLVLPHHFWIGLSNGEKSDP